MCVCVCVCVYFPLRNIGSGTRKSDLEMFSFTIFKPMLASYWVDVHLSRDVRFQIFTDGKRLWNSIPSDCPEIRAYGLQHAISW
jgi:hypothetical protein